MIGSMTLFMTLGFEKYQGFGLFCVALLYALAFGIGGVQIWFQYKDYQMVGGLFCSISVSMMPLMVYGLQRHFRVWLVGDPGTFQDFRIWIKGSWAPMEIATCICSLGFLSLVRFPFLLAPAAFCLWFLSMDLIPLLFGAVNFKNRQVVSIWFGLFIILAGYASERTFGTVPDFGFWLYLFGLMAFWIGLTFYPSSFKESSFCFYILVNISLILIGRLVDRTTFFVFGMAGICIAFYGFFTRLVDLRSLQRGQVTSRTTITPTFLGQIFRGSCVMILLALSLSQGSSYFEFIPATVALCCFNAAFFVKFLGSSEIVYLFHLSLNLSVMFLAREFTSFWQLWILQSVSWIGILLFQFSIISVKTTPDTPVFKITYWIYRAVFSIFMCFLPSSLLIEDGLIWIGSLGLVGVACALSLSITELLFLNEISTSLNPQPLGIAQSRRFVLSTLLFTSGMLLLFWHGYFKDFVSFYSGIALVWASTIDLAQRELRGYGCFLSIIALLSSAPLGSSFLATIATLYIFGYLMT